MDLQLRDILNPSRTACDMSAGSSKRILEQIACLIAADLPGLNADTIFSHLVERESLGSTGMGNGVAIPHCRISGCPQVVGCCIRTAAGVDFSAPDDVPVDLFFTLLVPDQADQTVHLALLQQLARLFGDAEMCQRLRAAKDVPQLYKLLTGGAEQQLEP